MKPRSLLFALALMACPVGQAQSVDQRVIALADRLADQSVAYDPTLSYWTGLPSSAQSRFADRSPAGIAAFQRQERDDLQELRRLDLTQLTEAARPTFALLKERLVADLQMGICHQELWDVDHFGGWPAAMPQIAAQQRVATDKERQEALLRWKTLPEYIATDIANLRSGLRQGYSAPQSVVRRVLKQVDQLAPADLAQSPLYAPVAKSTDQAFREAYQQLLTHDMYPAIATYKQFLQEEYLPSARESLAVSALPNGHACYAAMLRANTTLTRSPAQVFALGQKTVAANLTAVKAVARENYGTTDIPTVLRELKANPTEQFHSAQDLIQFSRDFLARSRQATAARIVSSIPSQAAVVEPLSALEEAAGGNSRFQQEPDQNKPAKYLIQSSIWATELRAQAEIVTVHESFPGHALQQSMALTLHQGSKLSRLADNSAYNEGWARYAEFLGEEQGIYDTPDATILRRLWPARGMVVDPGIHVLGWTRQQAIDYILAAGRDTPQAAQDLVDRIAAMPGQLTSYDSGGLEILALRRMAMDQLGARFDLKTFNDAVLGEGSVPLPELRRHVEAWITSQVRTEHAHLRPGQTSSTRKHKGSTRLQASVQQGLK